MTISVQRGDQAGAGLVKFDRLLPGVVGLGDPSFIVQSSLLVGSPPPGSIVLHQVIPEVT